MSPLLFNLYMFHLIDTLERRGFGCHMGNLFTGCFINADDITLLAPSCQSLNEMLNICELYAFGHDSVFNPGKTRCTHFTNRNSASGSVHFMDNSLQFTETFSLLRINVLPDFKAEIDAAVHQFNN